MRHRSVGRCLLACLAVVAAFLAASVNARAAVENIVYSKETGAFGTGQVFFTDEQGAPAVTLDVGPTSRSPRLSPKGDYVAYEKNGSLYVRSTTTNNERMVHSSACARSPVWGPDSITLFFTDACSSTTYGDVSKVGINGSGLRKLIGWKGNQTLGDVSSDGRWISFDSDSTSAGKAQPNAVYVASALDGSAPRLLAPYSGAPFTAARAPSFNRDGTRVVFSGTISATNDDLFTINTGGTGGTVRVTTTGSAQERAGDWSPDGTSFCVLSRNVTNTAWSTPATVQVIDVGGAVVSTLAHGNTNNYTDLSPCSYRQSGAAADEDAALAANYRPHVRFDSSEQYRPLNVDAYFAERDASGQPVHVVCGSFCLPMNGTVDLGYFTSPDQAPYVARSGVADPSDETKYHTQDQTCLQTGRRDCDRGPATTMYYKVSSPSPGGYRYIDYWMYYRYNYFSSADRQYNHEGDWEAVSVAPSKGRKSTFDYASFSQHGTWYSYLRSVLSCDSGEPTWLAGNPASGTCGSSDAPQGQRVFVYPANGSHANYPATCSETVYGLCNQDSTWWPERGHDGTSEWTAQRSDELTSSLTAFPVAKGWASGTKGNFVDWPGLWGLPAKRLGHGIQDGPASPANQQPHWSMPWASTCSDTTPVCAKEASVTARAAMTAAKGDVASVAASCGNWFGGDVIAVVCEPTELRKSVKARQLGDRGAAAVRFSRPNAPVASAPGLLQVTGRPLQPGEQLSIVRSRRGSSLLIRARDGRQVAEARFVLDGPATSRYRIRALRTNGRLVIRMTDQNGRRVSAAETRRSPLR